MFSAAATLGQKFNSNERTNDAVEFGLKNSKQFRATSPSGLVMDSASIPNAELDTESTVKRPHI